jgi:hypothetical protein
MEFIAVINRFALMYGAMQAALDDERTRTGITELEQQAAPVKAGDATRPTTAMMLRATGCERAAAGARKHCGPA